MIVPDPLIHESTDVEANAAATSTTTEANDIVMAEDIVHPEVITAMEDNVKPSTSGVAVPPPVPHTMERAYNRGEIVTV